VQAVQLELVQLNYMDEASFEYDESRAPEVQAVIERLLRMCLD
jgi:N-formylglutamate deformylase